MLTKKILMKNKNNLTNLVRGGISRSSFSETSESIFLTSGFVYSTAEKRKKVSKKKKRDSCTQDLVTQLLILLKRMALLEGAEACWATSSGMSTLFTILMSYLKKGDRVVSSKALFVVVILLLRRFYLNLELKLNLLMAQI